MRGWPMARAEAGRGSGSYSGVKQRRRGAERCDVGGRGPMPRPARPAETQCADEAALAAPAGALDWFDLAIDEEVGDV